MTPSLISRRSAVLASLSVAFGYALHGCGSIPNPAALSAFGLNRTTFLRLIGLGDASPEEALDAVDQIFEETTASASSNGLDENVVHFAELARAVIRLTAAKGSDTDGSAPAARWDTYWDYFQLAQALARIYAPEIAERFEAPLARLEELAPVFGGGALPETEVHALLDLSRD